MAASVNNDTNGHILLDTVCFRIWPSLQCVLCDLRVYKCCTKCKRPSPGKDQGLIIKVIFKAQYSLNSMHVVYAESVYFVNFKYTGYVDVVGVGAMMLTGPR